MKCTRRHRGFTLTEMLFILAILGVASLLSARLFTASMRVIRTAPQSQDHYAAVDRMSGQMRSDVWGAATIELPDAHTLVLSRIAGDSIRWTFSDDAIVRTDSAGERRWSIGVPLTAERSGAALILKSDNGDELRFLSQMISAGGSR